MGLILSCISGDDGLLGLSYFYLCHDGLNSHCFLLHIGLCYYLSSFVLLCHHQPSKKYIIDSLKAFELTYFDYYINLTINQSEMSVLAVRITLAA